MPLHTTYLRVLCVLPSCFVLCTYMSTLHYSHSIFLLNSFLSIVFALIIDHLATMNFIPLSQINPTDRPQPIQIRVLKKWIPYNKNEEKRTELCYLFVDNYGNAIEAVADLTNAEYFNSIINVQQCYVVDKYVAIASRTYMKVVPHHASLRIGKRATFTPLNNKDIPVHYFSFATYNDLEGRMKLPKPLTDYIGRIEYMSPIIIRSGKRLRKIKIQDDSMHVIELTLWEEKAFEVQTEDVLGKAIAITSTLVTDFKGSLQLESTTATTTSINPNIPELQTYMNRFKDLRQPVDILPSDKHVTLSALLNKDTKEGRYTCTASITATYEHRGWFYAHCSHCGKKIHPEENGFVCEDCENDKNPLEPTFMYSLNTVITDSTASAEAVFFNESMTDILNISCRDMVMLHGNKNPKFLPKQIHSIKDTPKLLHINLKKDRTVIVNRAENERSLIPTSQHLPPNTPDPKKKALQYSAGTASTTKKPKK